MEVGQDGGWIAMEDGRIEVKGWLRRIPALWGKPRAEIDHRIHGDLFGTKTVDDAQDILLVLDRAVRLHIAQRPFWGNYGGTGECRHILHKRRGIMGIEYDEVIKARHDGTRRRQTFGKSKPLVVLILHHSIAWGWLPG